MSVGENITRFRAEKGVSQRDLAEAVGISQSMIAQIERGSKMPNVALADQIAKHLDRDLGDLLK